VLNETEEKVAAFFDESHAFNGVPGGMDSGDIVVEVVEAEVYYYYYYYVDKMLYR
jgi:hypothetical protein